ncbi:hypothetical protein [Acidaminococcus massiliensis]|jgi:hypothetical protein|uniref:hypothetical protein n=1 Tax=Acidaminococcus massiliensis TaxID=1852375 RepID=UPI002053B0DB|nr:hypothetical protein [Acidaminococcus massiliensis]DAR24883.1 MAG TPA: hypothetical protein [Caudoviricetes sp.]
MVELTIVLGILRIVLITGMVIALIATATFLIVDLGMFLFLATEWIRQKVQSKLHLEEEDNE